jgi:c-di-GMP-binding flagellar brake protein YcgR
MTDKDKELLQQAIARNMGVVLSLPSEGMLRHHKSRFLNSSDEGILIEAPSGERPLIAQLIEESRPAGISFKHGNSKAMCACLILRMVDEVAINDETAVNALLIGWPAELKAVQRRNNYRVEIPLSAKVSIRVWRINEKADYRDEPMSAQEVRAELRNLSLGGAGVRLLGKDNKPPVIDVEDRLRVQIDARGEVFVIEGKMRPPAIPPKDNMIFTGIQFKNLQEDIEGRKLLTQLTRVIGELQREELRRMRAGLTMTALIGFLFP